MDCSESTPETTMRLRRSDTRRYRRLLPVLMAATPRPMTTNRHHQPSRVGHMVRRGRNGRHHHSLSLQVRLGTHLMVASGSARNGHVLDYRSQDRLAVHAAALGRAALEENTVREGGDGQALHVVGHEVVAAVDQGMG